MPIHFFIKKVYNPCMHKPLVTISIPTFNSGKTIKHCLIALQRQAYPNIEINIIDGNSADDTYKIAKSFGINRFKKFGRSLLESRYEGVNMAKGEYILILDSDQLLKKDCIERAVELMQKNSLDMLCLEETVYESNTFIEKLFQLDRDLINRVCDLSPLTGVIMPRFFRTKMLRKAYENIPKELFSSTGGPDHAIVYFEAWKLSKKVAVLSHAVEHIEPTTFGRLWTKFYRWGYTSVSAHYGKYSRLMKSKERFRAGLFTQGLIVESIGSILLLLLKGLAFKSGFHVAKLKRYFVALA